MSTVILIIVVLAVGIYIGFMIGFSRAMREAASKICGTRRPIAGRLFVIIGCLSLLLALGSSLHTLHFIHAALHARGTVIEMREQTDKDTGGISYAPTFRFQDAAGVVHTVSSGLFQSPPEFHVGDTVTVLYPSDDPQTARIDNFWQVWGLPTLGCILGSICLLVGLIVICWPGIIGRLRGQTTHAPGA